MYCKSRLFQRLQLLIDGFLRVLRGSRAISRIPLVNEATRCAAAPAARMGDFRRAHIRAYARIRARARARLKVCPCL